MLRQIMSAAVAAVVLAGSIVPAAHAETVSQCRERAYRYYDAIVAEGISEAEAQRILKHDLNVCNAKSKSGDKDPTPKKVITERVPRSEAVRDKSKAFDPCPTPDSCPEPQRTEPGGSRWVR